MVPPRLWVRIRVRVRGRGRVRVRGRISVSVRVRVRVSIGINWCPTSSSTSALNAVSALALYGTCLEDEISMKGSGVSVGTVQRGPSICTRWVVPMETGSGTWVERSWLRALSLLMVH